MDIKTPTNWRKGQTLFNFLDWLRTEKGIVDPFYTQDETFNKLYNEFLELNK